MRGQQDSQRVLFDTIDLEGIVRLTGLDLQNL